MELVKARFIAEYTSNGGWLMMDSQTGDVKCGTPAMLFNWAKSRQRQMLPEAGAVIGTIEWRDYPEGFAPPQ